jgi:beta-glucosidase
MCSYNQVNGPYTCENPLLNWQLKGEDGFPGYVVSDFGAVHSTAPSLVNGLEQELNGPEFHMPPDIEAALASGEVYRQQIAPRASIRL